MLTLAPAELEEIGRLLTDNQLEMHAWLDTHTGEVILTQSLYGFDPDAPAESWELDANGEEEPADDERLSDWEKDERGTVAAICADRTRRYVRIPVGGSFRLGLLHDFANALPDGQLYEEVRAAMRGSGAFRRVKDVLHRFGKIELWHDFQNKEHCEVAREWLTEAGVEWQERDGRAPGRAPG